MPLSGCFRVRAWAKIAVVPALMAASLQAGADGTPIDEYQLKAVFLFNFAKFVEWPPRAFGDARDPFTICVWGDNPFGSSLDAIVHGKTVANRPIFRITPPDYVSRDIVEYVRGSLTPQSAREQNSEIRSEG